MRRGSPKEKIGPWLWNFAQSSNSREGHSDIRTTNTVCRSCLPAFVTRYLHTQRSLVCHRHGYGCLEQDRARPVLAHLAHLHLAAGELRDIRQAERQSVLRLEGALALGVSRTGRELNELARARGALQEEPDGLARGEVFRLDLEAVPVLLPAPELDVSLESRLVGLEPDPGAGCTPSPGAGHSSGSAGTSPVSSSGSSSASRRTSIRTPSSSATVSAPSGSWSPSRVSRSISASPSVFAVAVPRNEKSGSSPSAGGAAR